MEALDLAGILSSIIVAALVGIVAWTAKHSQRLTQVETDLAAHKESGRISFKQVFNVIKQNREAFERRMDNDYGRLEKRMDAISHQQQRIEDKLDKLVDRWIKE